MENKLVVNIPTFTNGDSTFPKPVNENYEYWIPLLKYFLIKSEAIEIHCWNEEIESIEELKSIPYAEFEMVKKEHLTIFKATKTTTLSDYLLYKSVGKNEELKWFTVNLKKGMQSMFHSGHWGTEFFIPKVLKEDLVYIKSITPNETIFHRF